MKQFFGNMKLKTKFTLVMILIAIIPTLVLGVFFFGRLYDMIISDTIRQEQDASTHTAPLIEKSIDKVLSAYDVLSEQSLFDSVFHKPMDQYVIALAASREGSALQDCVDTLKKEYGLSSVKIYADLPADFPLFEQENTKDIFSPMQVVQGTYWHGIFAGSHISELFCPPFYLGAQEQQQNGDLAYIRSSTLVYNDTNYSAYIALYFSSDQLQEILEENLTLAGSVSYIINDRNALVASSNESLSGIYQLDYDVIRQSFMSSNNFIERTILDEKVYAGFYSITAAGWFMVTVLPSKPLVHQSFLLMLQYVGFLVVFLLIALTLATVLTHSVTNRISSVIARMQQVRLGPPVPMDVPKQHDEIGDLIETYNYMTKKIDQLMKEQQKAAEDLRIAEFNSLQAQINPHFLYNTMDMINWLSQQGQTEKVTAAVQNLSQFYKLTLSRKNPISTIAQEEEHVTIYVRLQNMRFHDGIDFVSDIPDELLSYQIPKLTLQPVVENAILHGILEKESKQGTIVLTGWMEEEDLILLISDDGIGIAKDKLQTILTGTEKSSSGGSNIAIYNTHRRLQLLYGPSYGLAYKSEPGQGTEVQIRIPAKRGSKA